MTRPPRRAASRHEDPDADQHDRLAADEVGELAVDRHRHGLGQQVDREQPRELGEPAEVVDHRRDGGREDRRVDRDQAGAQHHGEQDRAALAAQPNGGA